MAFSLSVRLAEKAQRKTTTSKRFSLDHRDDEEKVSGRLESPARISEL
jgi:hypothetical protein